MPDGHVESLADFWEEIEAWREVHFVELRGEVSSMAVYRGQSNSSWALQPALYRSDLYLEEQNLVADALRLLPHEFQSSSKFQHLAKMQHFGLPTRLLDVTTNPLIALYFACVGEPGRDGKVFVFPNLPTVTDQNLTVCLVMEFVFRGTWGRMDVDQLDADFRAGLGNDNRAKAVHLKSLETLTVPIQSVLAAHDNERLQAQSGAFLLCGMEVAGDVPGYQGKPLINFKPASLATFSGHPKNPDEVPAGGLSLVVPAKHKTRLLRQLDRIDVNRWRLFPGPEGALQYLRDAYVNAFREGGLAATVRFQKAAQQGASANTLE